MKVEMEFNEEHLRLIIKALEVYARSTLSQADLVGDMLADDVFVYDKSDPDNDERFHTWLEHRDEMRKHLQDAFDVMYGRNINKSDLTKNLIDIWHVFTHYQYNHLPDENKLSWDVRSNVPFQCGTEPLITLKDINTTE